MDLNQPEIKKEIYQFRVEQLKKLRSFLKSKWRSDVTRVRPSYPRPQVRLEGGDRADRENQDEAPRVPPQQPSLQLRDLQRTHVLGIRDHLRACGVDVSQYVLILNITSSSRSQLASSHSSDRPAALHYNAALDERSEIVSLFHSWRGLPW